MEDSEKVGSVQVDSVQVGNALVGNVLVGVDAALGDSGREGRSREGTGCVRSGSGSLAAHGDGGGVVVDAECDWAGTGDCTRDAGSWGHLDSGGHR